MPTDSERPQEAVFSEGQIGDDLQPGEMRLVFGPAAEGPEDGKWLHKCAGCGALSFATNHTVNAQTKTVRASIACHKCPAHYYITNGKIEYVCITNGALKEVTT
jgi:hypothetical protein